ncbi:ATP-binding protein [Eupransor demetentiae]|uniref:Contains AAA domain (YhaN) n=1 Tax=Eupransor demetentiae TaxID=3109584 RepID=A0ABP0ENR1_9LACO|nr:Uncharacterized conserved protein YhaN [Lactobacillaceae bacterium LMG 33000]
MKIKKIIISGFGKWSNVTFDSLSDFQIFAGPNEAGKSTMQAFILGIFFGFPNRGKFKNTYEPRNGSRYGGALTVQVDQQDYRIERYNRLHSELVVTNLQNGKSIEKAQDWLTQLFGPLDQDNYQELFSFNSDQLNQLRKLNQNDLNELFLHLGDPIRQKWWAYANQLDEAGDAVFAKAKTAKRPLNMALKNYQHLRLNQQNQQGERALYQRNQQEIESLKVRQKHLREQKAALASQLEQARISQRDQSLREEMMALKAELDQAPVKQIAVTDLQKAQQLNAKISNLSLQIEEVAKTDEDNVSQPERASWELFLLESDGYLKGLLAGSALLLLLALLNHWSGIGLVMFFVLAILAGVGLWHNRQNRQTVTEVSQPKDFLENLQKNKNQLGQELQDILWHYQVDDFPAFIRSYQQQVSREQKLQRYRDLQRQVSTASVAGDLNELQTRAAAVEEELEEKQSRIANLLAEQKQLARTDSALFEQQDLANHLFGIQNGTFDYLVNKLSASWIQQTLAGELEQGWARMIQQAQIYLARLTQNSYRQIFLEKGQLLVRNDAQLTFEPFELSRGTREQLYLAIRLAMIKTINLPESFPLLIDDAFVNFDPVRRQEVLSLLQEISQEEQILLWLLPSSKVPVGAINLEEK